MKGILGGALVAGLVAAGLEFWIGVAIMLIIAILAGAASWKAEEIKEKQAASWRNEYPTYKY